MIRLLDTATINKIAAGEVIERPFSVVKELVENSIDAGSKKIVVEIKDGGIPFIRVTDDGAGISSEEIEIAFTSHATSKLNTISDLNSIDTLGFRGEALASIAAVSQLEITSKSAGQETGVCLEIFGGEMLGRREVACGTGTSIVVRNIFYNTPARKKFIKSPPVETGYISDFISKIALSKPDISFRLINNGNEMIFTSGNADLKTAIFCVYGIEYTEKLIGILYEKEGIGISGFVGKPELSRANRLSQDIFVNGRFVKDKTVRRGVEDAFKTYLTVGRFPVFILNINLHPKGVDVNAHPQKLEIRFADEQGVYEAVFNATREALKSVSLIPSAYSMSMPTHENNTKKPENTSGGEAGNPEIFQISEWNIDYPEADMKQSFAAMETGVFVLDKPADVERPKKAFEAGLFDLSAVKGSDQVEFEKEQLFSSYRIIGQAFQTYWIVEQDSKLYVIDQHAAHERILFEKVLDNFVKGEVISQKLVLPEKLVLTEREKGLVGENDEYFREMGFEIEEVNDEFYLKGLPVLLSAPENTKTIRQLIDLLSIGNVGTTTDSMYSLKVNTLATIACKAAVKGKDRLNEREARAIIEELLTMEHPFTCPHGRPTIVEIGKREVEAMFKRT